MKKGLPNSISDRHHREATSVFYTKHKYVPVPRPDPPLTRARVARYMKVTKNKMRQAPTSTVWQGKDSNRGDSDSALSTIIGKGSCSMVVAITVRHLSWSNELANTMRTLQLQ